MRDLRNYQKKAIEQLSDTGDNVLYQMLSAQKPNAEAITGLT